MEKNIYDVDYFIKKFSAIPEEKWLVGDYSNETRTAFCAAGHCGVGVTMNHRTDECQALGDLFRPHFSGACIPMINDGEDHRYQQPTPKQRILAALNDIKAKQQPEVKVKTVYVMRDAVVKDLTEEVVLSPN